MRFTLLADGPTDEILVPIASWLLRQRTTQPFDSQWAELRSYPRRVRGLSERIRVTLELYPCDLLLIHRDAEREPREARAREIDRALVGLEHPPVVRVIPVRMQDAWLLFDEAAIRMAAGCPNGKVPLDLPPLRRVEQDPDPKNTLHEQLRRASGLSGRRAKQFLPHLHARRLADILDDFEPLRQLPAFQAFEEELMTAIGELGCPLLSCG